MRFKYDGHDSQGRMREDQVVEANSMEHASEIIRHKLGLFPTKIWPDDSKVPEVPVTPVTPDAPVAPRPHRSGDQKPGAWRADLEEDMTALSAALRAISEMRGTVRVGDKTWEAYDAALPHVVGEVVADSIKRVMGRIRAER